MQVVVTGAAGYIGSRLADRLRNAGHRVVGLDRDERGESHANRFVKCDLLDVRSYVDALNGADWVFHLAAAKGDWGISESEYSRDNVEATRCLIEAMRQANVLNCVFYSTVSVLGPSEVALAEDGARHPVNPYGASKARCEALYDTFVKDAPGARVVSIRPSVVFGPENPWNTNIFRLIDAIHRRRFLMIGRGREVKTTSYIENLLKAHEFLMIRETSSSSSGHEIIHYVDDPAETTAQIVQRIRALLGKSVGRAYLPLGVAAPIASIGDVLASLTGIDFPITRARVQKFCTATNFSAAKIRDLGFEQPISNETAMRRSVEWYLDEYTGRT